MLVNERADGSPCVIVAVTPREFEREEDLVMAEVGHGEWVDWAVRSSLNVLISELGGVSSDLSPDSSRGDGLG